MFTVLWHAGKEYVIGALQYNWPSVHMSHGHSLNKPHFRYSDNVILSHASLQCKWITKYVCYLLTVERCQIKTNNAELTWKHIKCRRGYIYGAVKGHRDVTFTAAVQSLDGAKHNTNPKINPNLNTNLTVILILAISRGLLVFASLKWWNMVDKWAAFVIVTINVSLLLN